MGQISAKDFSKTEDDGSTTLVRQSIVDGQGEVIVDDVVSDEWRRKIVSAVNSLDQAREAFLNMIADADVWEEDVDGDADDYGRPIVNITYRIEVDRFSLEQLTDALGIKAKWGESLKDAIDRAVAV